MNGKEIVAKLKQKKVQDYSLTIVFFVIFSFFVFFAIRPNLITAFNLRKELSDLRIKDKQFEDTILKIVDYQTTLETNRDNFSLLDEAIPQSPQIYKIIDDVRNSASLSGMQATSLNVEEIDLEGKKDDNKLKSYSISLTTPATQAVITQFINDLYDQRRLKSIRELTISQASGTGAQSSFNISLIVDGYYF